jgi:transposase InsO family protein
LDTNGEDSTGAVIGSTTVRDDGAAESASPARFRNSTWWGGDGSALMSTAIVMPNWANIVVVGDAGPVPCAAAQPQAIGEKTPAITAPLNQACSAAPQRGGERQAERRRSEHLLRERSVAFALDARGWGLSCAEVAEILGVAPRTLSQWTHDWATGRLIPHLRGRPPWIAPAERGAEVTRFLGTYGPSLSIATLKAEYPDVARAQLTWLRADYRASWRAAHRQQRCQLEWLSPGRVWAIDFSHPPHLIDGVFRAILNVRDLASHQQLLWLAVADETAATLVDALDDLFQQHGAPLVLKCDNGPAFVARATKEFLRDAQVFPLYSPPYCARYNGACERANRSLKELTSHMAEQAGRSGFWTSEDLLAARLRANRLTRPWGAEGPTPDETWTSRSHNTLDERTLMWQYLKRGIETVLTERTLDPDVALPHYTQTEIERIAAPPVLETLGLLHVTRRQIAPVI